MPSHDHGRSAMFIVARPSERHPTGGGGTAQDRWTRGGSRRRDRLSTFTPELAKLMVDADYELAKAEVRSHA